MTTRYPAPVHVDSPCPVCGSTVPEDTEQIVWRFPTKSFWVCSAECAEVAGAQARLEGMGKT